MLTATVAGEWLLSTDFPPQMRWAWSRGKSFVIWAEFHPSRILSFAFLAPRPSCSCWSRQMAAWHDDQLLLLLQLAAAAAAAVHAADHHLHDDTWKKNPCSTSCCNRTTVVKTWRQIPFFQLQQPVTSSRDQICELGSCTHCRVSSLSWCVCVCVCVLACNTQCPKYLFADSFKLARNSYCFALTTWAPAYNPTWTWCKKRVKTHHHHHHHIPTILIFLPKLYNNPLNKIILQKASQLHSMHDWRHPPDPFKYTPCFRPSKASA